MVKTCSVSRLTAEQLEEYIALCVEFHLADPVADIGRYVARQIEEAEAELQRRLHPEVTSC